MAAPALVDWEAARLQMHLDRMKQAESALCNLQIRARSGFSSVDAWMQVMELRSKLQDGAAQASTSFLSGLENSWRLQRLEACDGEAAAWLLEAERQHAAALRRRAGAWAAAAPPGGLDLRQHHRALIQSLEQEVARTVQAWEAAHGVVRKAWDMYLERMAKAVQAVGEKQAPPDSWLSEVRYRECVQQYALQQGAAEAALKTKAAELAELDVQRAAYWESLTAAYAEAAAADGLLGADAARSLASDGPDAAGGDPALPEASCLPASGHGCLAPAPPVRQLPPVNDIEERPSTLPEVPGPSGFVLRQVKGAIQAPPGFLGLGGGGWLDGATLVLTAHGYLHVFHTAAKNNSAGKDAQLVQPETKGNELRESDIKASVYVPLATRCLFLRKGAELTLDVAEAEALEDSAQAHSTGDRLRKWISRAPAGAAIPPRRAHARVADVEEFRVLESACQDFVRQGQRLRASGSTPHRAERYLVDNAELKADAPGLEYRLSPDLAARAGSDAFEPWGSVVTGVSCGDEWLQVGDRFLPFKVNGIAVVRRA